jgi:thiol-disulfide isomerase/thioredoxin
MLITLFGIIIMFSGCSGGESGVISAKSNNNVNSDINSDTATDEMSENDNLENDTENIEDNNEIQDNEPEVLESNPIWKTTILTDVISKKQFSIEDKSGEVILLESFAVWCPTCKKQQDIMKEFHKANPDVVTISLNTDPNEDESKVLEFANENGFDWYYAVSPSDMTQSLIDDFGVGVVNAPAVPIVLICENGNSHLLDRGLKQVEEIETSITELC